MNRLSIVAAARAWPDALGLVFEGEHETFLQLALRASAVCDQLTRRGVRLGDRVALHASNTPATMVTLLALIEMGVTAVLLHPRLQGPEVAALVDDAAPARVLDASAVAQLGALPPSETLWAPPGGARVPPDGVAAMVYTSGTSGRPKGALLSTAALIASARASAENLGWRDDDRWLLALPLCHVGGLSVLTRCLLAGRAVVLHPRFEVERFVRAIEVEGVTMASVVPTMLGALLDGGGAALARLRVLLVGGAATHPALRARALAAGVRVVPTYGLTEGCSQVATRPLDDRSDREGVGYPLSSVSVRVCEGDRVCARGEVGTLQIRGESVMLGYWREAPLGGAWFDTGDLASLADDGWLTLYSRRSDLIVRGGENVYPAEVEAALAGLAGVTDAVVYGVDDPHWGQVVAAVIASDVPESVLVPRVQAALRARIAAFKVPVRWRVVAELPRLASGKVDRRAAVG